MAAYVMAVSATAATTATAQIPGDSGHPVSFQHEGKKLTVMLGDQEFTTFDYGSHDKPILYPIYGPGQIGMTRNWPMAHEVRGEAHDHPHHKSMWISHEISGVDFWSERDGEVITPCIETKFAGKPKPSNVFRSTSFWVKKSDTKTLLTDQTTYWFGGDHNSRWIDCLVNFRATHGDIQFDDTKEGLFAIRTHPDLRLTASPKHGVEKVYGTAINSEGVTGKEVWGKKAKWLLYRGTIDGTPMSIAMFDHPTNLRHPTTWHARDYGLVTANPFGLHHFSREQEGAGAFTVRQGDNLFLRYRIEFFQGDVSVAEVERKFQSFAAKELANLVFSKR